MNKGEHLLSFLDFDDEKNDFMPECNNDGCNKSGSNHSQ